MSKVFLSYSSKDVVFVEELYRRLTRDGVECFFDRESIAWGANWVVELEKGLKECAFIVLVLTPDFCTSEWTKLERTSILAEDPAGTKKKMRPLLLKPCNDDMPYFLKPIQHKDISSDKKFEAQYPQICRDLGGNYTPETIETVDRTKLPPLCSLPPNSVMSYRSLNDKFAGRIADLWAIDDGLQRHSTAVVQGVGLVTGMGGLGKSQLAVEYIHRFGCHFPGGVFWIDAEMGRQTMIDLIADACEIKLDPQQDEQKQLEVLWRELAGEGGGRGKRVLIVLDNFPEREDLETWLPSRKSIFTLVTSRRKDFYNYFHYNLDKLKDDDALALLNSGVRKFSAEEAQPLIDSLEGLPLALELVKHFLNARTELSIEGLLAEMKAMGDMEALKIFADRYANQLPTGHEKQVAATFGMGWDLASPMERDVLHAMASLAPAPVPRRLLVAILKNNKKGFKQFIRRFFKRFGLLNQSKLQDPLDDALSRLHQTLSLVELDTDSDPRMHRLIAAFVRTIEKKTEDIQEKAAAAVEQEMARVTDDTDTASFRELEKILPHGDFLLGSKVLKPERAIDIADGMGWHHKKWGRYRQGEKYWREALDLARTHLSTGHPSIARSQSNLATVLRDLGQLEEARDLLRQALEADKKSFEPGHPAIAIRQSNLALVLRDLGQLEEARDLLREALEAAKKSFEPGHPSIAIRQSNLALVLQDLGQLEEALDLMREALEADKKSFEPGHPAIARSQSNLALVLQDLGQLEEARDLLREALDADKKSFEPGHPSIASSQSNLASVLADLGEFPEALELLTGAYHDLLNSQGADFPMTKIVKGNLEEVKKRANKKK